MEQLEVIRSAVKNAVEEAIGTQSKLETVSNINGWGLGNKHGRELFQQSFSDYIKITENHLLNLRISHNTLVAINRLPVELFTCIIAFAELPTDKFNHPFLIYTWVCRHWRSIVVQQTDFWTLFRLQLVPNNEVINPFIHELLRRSKSAKLDAALTLKSPQSAPTLEGLINKESSRIVRLWLSTDQPQLIQSVFSNKCFSSLQAVTYVGSSRSLVALLPTLVASDQLNTLQCTLGVTFSISNLNALAPVFSRLRSLSLYIHLPEVFQSVLLLLHNNSQLQDLQLEVHDKKGTDISSQIILPELRFLSTRFLAVLEQFRTPKLSALDVDYSDLPGLLKYPIFEGLNLSPIRCLYILDPGGQRHIHSIVGLNECFHAETLFSTKTEGFVEDIVFLEDVEDIFTVTDISLHSCPRDYFNIGLSSDEIPKKVLEPALSSLLPRLTNLTELYLLSRALTGVDGIPFNEIASQIPTVEKLVVQHGDKLKTFIALLRTPSICPRLKHLSYTISDSVSQLYGLIETFAEDIGKALTECLKSRREVHGDVLKFIALGNCPPLPGYWLEEMKTLGTMVVTEKTFNSPANRSSRLGACNGNLTQSDAWPSFATET